MNREWFLRQLNKNIKEEKEDLNVKDALETL